MPHNTDKQALPLITFRVFYRAKINIYGIIAATTQYIILYPKYINVYLKIRMPFCKKNQKLFSFTAENQYLCTPIRERI